MDAEQILAFRLARLGLASRDAGDLAGAAACPVSDFSRDAALTALAARCEDLTRESYHEAIDRGDLVLAHLVRAAIHAVAPNGFSLYGRVLVSTDDHELGVQLGRQVQRLATAKSFAATDALDEVAEATRTALDRGRALTRNELHDELRRRVRADFMPWCKGCKSHHVAPMLWRYACVKSGARIDAKRRYLLGKPGPSPAAADTVKSFLGFYGPATAGDFAEWAGVARPHADRLWEKTRGDMREVSGGGRTAWVMSRDLHDLNSPPEAKGVRLIPPGDPYLQKPNRALLVPEAALRRRLFRSVGSPGAVLKDGRLAGLWRVKATGRKAEITVEKLGRVRRKELENEAQRVARLRGASRSLLVVE